MDYYREVLKFIMHVLCDSGAEILRLCLYERLF